VTATAGAPVAAVDRTDRKEHAVTVKLLPGHTGDWLDVHAPGGGPPRHGQIVEVLGAVGHERYRVRWIDGRESIFFPAEGTYIRPAAHADAGTARTSD
jgi:hypothetical protein